MRCSAASVGMIAVDGNPALAQTELVARQAQRWNDPKTEHDAQARIALASVRAKRNEGRARSQLARLRKAPRMGTKSTGCASWQGPSATRWRHTRLASMAARAAVISRSL